MSNVRLKGSLQCVTGVVNTTTAGARRQMPNVACTEITVIAKLSNTGSIYVGDSNTNATNYGVELKAGAAFTFAIGNANLLHIVGSVNGEGVSYVAV